MLLVAKEELIYARISTELKRKLSMEMTRRGEAEAVIVREALNEYFDRREAYRLNESNSSIGQEAARRIVDLAAGVARGATTARRQSKSAATYKAPRNSKKKPAAATD